MLTELEPVKHVTYISLDLSPKVVIFNLGDTLESTCEFLKIHNHISISGRRWNQAWVLFEVPHPGDSNMQHRAANPWSRWVSLRCCWHTGMQRQMLAPHLLHPHPSLQWVLALRSQTQVFSLQKQKTSSWVGSHLDFTKIFGKRKGQYFFNFVS